MSGGSNAGPSKKVGDILPRVMKDLGLEEKVEERRLRRDWAEIVGGAVARRSRPRCVRGKTLFIGVADNVWMQEIRFHQQEIVEKVRKEFPKLDVKSIRLELERERNTE
jgi:predicted nucleic acid-binding Zn ribbon protein